MVTRHLPYVGELRFAFLEAQNGKANRDYVLVTEPAEEPEEFRHNLEERVSIVLNGRPIMASIVGMLDMDEMTGKVGVEIHVNSSGDRRLKQITNSYKRERLSNRLKERLNALGYEVISSSCKFYNENGYD